MKWLLMFTLIAWLDAPWYMWVLCSLCWVIDLLYHFALVDYLSDKKGGADND